MTWTRVAAMATPDPQWRMPQNVSLPFKCFLGKRLSDLRNYRSIKFQKHARFHARLPVEAESINK
jgi:hypothetical protein